MERKSTQSDRLTIVLIGSGQVATHLGQALFAAGYRILQVISRTLSHAEALASTLQAQASDPFDAIVVADVYFIAVQDDAIAQVAAQLSAPAQSLVIHTSGSTSLEVLQQPERPHYGVFYPLQTFSKQKKVDMRQVPIAVEGSDDHSLKLLHRIGQDLSEQVFTCDSAQRMKLHMAAVFACNFTNHLYALAEKLLAEEGFSLDLIRPLIEETSQKAQQFSPQTVQTGPAVRGDQKILAKHLAALQNKPAYQQLYRLLSESIQAHR
jgi:predicted short-subunit dehydrogenase-like oxidoreductase (DUF2520 family)